MSEHPVKRRKKLIEVAIPLEAINQACQEEKAVPRRGHPGTMHFWWAPRPLAAARAILFCQLVDDPSSIPESFSTQEAIDLERLRLFSIISRLSQWDSAFDKDIIKEAKAEIIGSWERFKSDNEGNEDLAFIETTGSMPQFLDPFAGGGAIPLEAQRLGLKAIAADLNPVSVVINKAKIEIPSSIPSSSPILKQSKELFCQDEFKIKGAEGADWPGSTGLAEDVYCAGSAVLERVRKCAASAYPLLKISEEIVRNNAGVADDLTAIRGKELPVLACFWARTVESPSPAFSGQYVPLIKSWTLAEKKNIHYWLDVAINEGNAHFTVCKGAPPESQNAKRLREVNTPKSGFKCLLSGDVITFKYIRESAQRKKLSFKLLAVVCQAPGKRIYLSPDQLYEETCLSIVCQDLPHQDLPFKALGFRVQEYGMKKWSDLFLPRQNYILNEFSREIQSISQYKEFENCGTERTEAIKTYLACALSRLADYNNTFCSWNIKGGSVSHLFTKHAIPMSWDFVEICPLEDFSGCWDGAVKWVSDVLRLRADRPVGSLAIQRDARLTPESPKVIISTDPPYYDNIGYADLSDFFYVWMRKALRGCHGKLLATTLTPKTEELIASPFRHEKVNPEQFFLEGMTEAMSALKVACHPFAPITIYYAFKQSETKDGDSVKTGWSTFLQAVIDSGLQIQGTWPVRTERAARSIGIGTNALASSIVLVCQPAAWSRPVITRAEFKRKLRSEMPAYLRTLESAGITPVDIAQAVMGPGMAIYSSARSVLYADDSCMSVRDALIEIGGILDECLAQGEGDLDEDSRFALAFYESYGYSEREFGDAENLAKARNVSVAGIEEAGILRSVAGKVWLLQRSNLEKDWDPECDKRLCIWEATQQLIRRLEADGEDAAAALLFQLKQISGHGDLAANCKALAYRLYNHCEKTKQGEEARSYNGLVMAWEEIERQASSQSSETTVQASLI